MRTEHGFTLIEILMVIVIIGILAAIAATSLTQSVDDQRRTETERELAMLADAIVGNPELKAGGTRGDFGYIGDIGAFPPNLQALYQNPGGYATWDGPYLPAGFLEDSAGFKFDAWGEPYTYNGGATISSSGGGAPIMKKIAAATSDYLLNSLRGSVLDAAGAAPGIQYVDSVTITVSYPDGAGNSLTRIHSVDYAGTFVLDSLPVGTHALRAIFIPRSDTLLRYVTILPRHKSRFDLKFARSCFSDVNDTTPAMTDTIYFSTAQSGTFAGLACSNDQVIAYNGPSDVASIYLDGDTVFSGNENIDALHILANGHLVLSTSSSATIDGVSFQDDDLVDFNPSTGKVTIFFDGGSVFSGNENIDAVYMRDGGTILLSTENSAAIGALSFDGSDIVEYNPSTGAASLFFDGSSVFTGSANINAIYVRENGNVILSVDGSGCTLGSVTFGREDIVEYDPATGQAFMLLDGNDYFETFPIDINALHLGAGVGSSVDMSAGLVGYWKFDESGGLIAADASGSGIDGTLNNMDGTEWTTGILNGALEFNGTNDYVEIPHDVILNGSTRLTYSAWVYPHSWNGVRQVLAKSVHAGGSGRSQMGIFSENDRLCGRAETYAGRKEITATLPVLNTWSHIALVFDSVNLKLYVNGAVADSSTFSATSLIPNTDVLDISKRVGSNQYFFDGLIDDVRVYTIAAPHSVINALNDMGH